MTLPVLNNPNYEMELPSTGEKIEFRPFLVKEQKILMMAMESDDTSSQSKAVVDIINLAHLYIVDIYHKFRNQTGHA